MEKDNFVKDSKGFEVRGNIEKFSEIFKGLKPDEKLTGNPMDRATWKIVKFAELQNNTTTKNPFEMLTGDPNDSKTWKVASVPPQAQPVNTNSILPTLGGSKNLTLYIVIGVFVMAVIAFFYFRK